MNEPLRKHLIKSTNSFAVSARDFPFNFLALTINIDLERLIGNRWDPVVGYASVHAHVHAVDFRDVQSVAGHRCRLPRAVGDGFLVLTYPLDWRLREAISRTA